MFFKCKHPQYLHGLLKSHSCLTVRYLTRLRGPKRSLLEELEAFVEVLLGIEAFVFEVIIDELFATVEIFDVVEVTGILLI